VLCMWCVSALEICLKSNKTMYDCDATVLLNVYIHVVFVGEGYAELVTSNLPCLRVLSLMGCGMCVLSMLKNLRLLYQKRYFAGFNLHAAVCTSSVHKGYLVNGADSNSANYK